MQKTKKTATNKGKKAKKSGKKPAAATTKAAKAPSKERSAKVLKPQKAEVIPAAAVKEKATKAKGAAKSERSKKGKNCTEPGCALPQLTDQYCRLHYIKNWASIISGRRAQARANLNKYIETLSEKYPDEYMEKIRDDLGNEGAFHARLRELGFREEYESGASSGDNPFQMENFDEFVHGLKFDE